VLGEFFSARVEDIDEALVERGPFGRFPTVEAKGLTEVNLATLGEILGVGTYDDLVDPMGEGPQTEGGEAGVLTIPTVFRDAVGGGANLDSAAERWVASEEMAMDGWEKGDALQVLRDLSALAQSAAREERNLWYWWSL
jgi:hypothetical protein